MRGITLFACAMMVGTLPLSSAHAQVQCASRMDVVKVLAAKYQESPRAFGLINEKAMMEIFTSPKGTWTLIVTHDNGLTCVVASGEAWDEMPVTAMGPAS